LFLYALFRLRYAGSEPRIAGVGNGLNCAIAMFILPVGAVNAGDPYAADHEAAELGMAEAHSFPERRHAGGARREPPRAL
jgi:hypothetical protein